MFLMMWDKYTNVQNGLNSADSAAERMRAYVVCVYLSFRLAPQHYGVCLATHGARRAVRRHPSKAHPLFLISVNSDEWVAPASTLGILESMLEQSRRDGATAVVAKPRRVISANKTQST
jgi:hypothetical protein